MKALPYLDLEEELPAIGERVLLFDSAPRREHVVAWRVDRGAQSWIWAFDGADDPAAWDWSTHRYWLPITAPAEMVTNTDHRGSGEGGASGAGCEFEGSPGATGAPPTDSRKETA